MPDENPSMRKPHVWGDMFSIMNNEIDALKGKIRGCSAYSGNLFNLVVVRFEGWHDELLDSIDKATTIPLEALQELRLEVLHSD